MRTTRTSQSAHSFASVCVVRLAMNNWTILCFRGEEAAQRDGTWFWIVRDSEGVDGFRLPGGG
jgi:hypothetical protein